jgi:hypothetical protein
MFLRVQVNRCRHHILVKLSFEYIRYQNQTKQTKKTPLSLLGERSRILQGKENDSEDEMRTMKNEGPNNFVQTLKDSSVKTSYETSWL